MALRFENWSDGPGARLRLVRFARRTRAREASEKAIALAPEKVSERDDARRIR